MSRTLALSFLLLALFSCNHITPGSSLSGPDTQRLEKLGLLDKNETVVRFYSALGAEKEGNFFTDKRLASYWLDDDPEETEISWSYYPNIKAIDTVYYAGATYAPYMKVTKNDGKKFKVYVDGEKAELKAFFEQAMKYWKSGRQPR